MGRSSSSADTTNVSTTNIGDIGFTGQNAVDFASVIGQTSLQSQYISTQFAGQNLDRQYRSLDNLASAIQTLGENEQPAANNNKTLVIVALATLAVIVFKK